MIQDYINVSILIKKERKSEEKTARERQFFKS